MNKNTQGTGYQIQEMSLLVNDHKMWLESSKKPIPMRPVLSGNNCLNTHLSELVSELLEPISIRLNGGEINSTEEAAFQIMEINRMIRNIPDWREYDILKTLGKLENPTQEVYQVNGRDLENNNSSRGGDMIIMNGAVKLILMMF